MFLSPLIDAILPPICLSCRTYLKKEEKDLWLCTPCEKNFLLNLGFYCPECKRRLPGMEVLCHKNARFVLAAPFDFENIKIKNLIYLFKYKKVKKAATPLAFFLASCLERSFADNGVLSSFTFLPVPLHRSKERKRGFNQSALLVKLLEEKTRWIAEYAALKRVKKTMSQTKQESHDARKENMQGAFAVTDESKINNRNIIVVDDVYTSGATMHEIARVLKAAGAKTIIALTVAKT